MTDGAAWEETLEVMLQMEARSLSLGYQQLSESECNGSQVFLVPPETLEDNSRIYKVGGPKVAHEIAILNRLGPHPFICEIYETGWAPPDEHYFFQEYLPFGLTEAVVDPDAIEALPTTMEPVLSVLEHTHKYGYVFSDLARGNIRLKPKHSHTLDDPIQLSQNTMILTDFGNAQRLNSRTHILGTAPYAAPEQYLRGMIVTPATDIYSFGVLLCEMLTKQEYSITGDVVESISMGYNCGLPYNSTAKATLANQTRENLDRVIIKCVQINPADRYQSIPQLRQALHQAFYLESNYFLNFE